MADVRSCPIEGMVVGVCVSEIKNCCRRVPNQQHPGPAPGSAGGRESTPEKGVVPEKNFGKESRADLTPFGFYPGKP
jgi:hypothetical protein